MGLDLINSVMAGVDQQIAATRFLERTAAAQQVQPKTNGFAAQLAQVVAQSAPAAPGAPFQNAPLLAAKKLQAHGSSEHLGQKQQEMLALEGTLTTKMADEMLPKDEHGLYGGGLAGDTWRGFEVENIGQTLAKSDLLHFNRTPPAAMQPNNSLFAASGAPANPEFKITPFAG